MRRRRTTIVLGAALLVLAVSGRASAQEPSAPPPPAGGGGHAGPRYHELLPDIGRIGAQVGAAVGPSWNPYGVGPGWQVGGFIDLPLARNRAGRLSYEIVLALSAGESGPFTVTDPLAYVANLARGASPADALAGPPRAPYLVRRQVRTRLRLLDVSPFALKYTLTGFDRLRLRPYLTAGVDVAMVATDQRPEGDIPAASAVEAALSSGGRAPELDARGIPAGEGSLVLGGHGGAGLEVRLSRGLSVNFDYRIARLEGSQTLHAATTAVGLHW
jgi:opacity protein-like surface antigen